MNNPGCEVLPIWMLGWNVSLYHHWRKPPSSEWNQTCYEKILQSKMQVFFVYETSYCKAEDDDPKDAILYFHPQEVSDSQKCALCCQLVGTVQFFSSCFTLPTIINLEKGKFAVHARQQFLVALGGSTDMPDSILISQLHYLLAMVQFYHQSIGKVKNMCGKNRTKFLDEMHVIWQHCLPVSQHYGDVLSLTFSAVPYLNNSEFQVSINLEALHLVHGYQKYSAVITGSVFCKKKVVCTQFPPEMTQMLLVLQSPQHEVYPANVGVQFLLPPGVSLKQVYLTRVQLMKLIETNSHSRATCFKIQKYLRSTRNSVTPKELTTTDSEEVCSNTHRLYKPTNISNATVNHGSKPRSLQQRCLNTYRPTKYSSVSDDHDQGLKHAAVLSRDAKPILSGQCSKNDFCQSVVESKVEHKIDVKVHSLVKDLNVKQKFETLCQTVQKSLSSLSLDPVLQQKKVEKSQVTPVNDQPFNVLIGGCRRTSRRYHPKTKRKTSRERLKYQTTSISDSSCLLSKDAVSSSDFCVNIDGFHENKVKKDPFLKIGVFEKPVLNEKNVLTFSDATEYFPNFQDLDVRLKHNNSNLEMFSSVTGETDWYHTLLTSFPHLNNKESMDWPLKFTYTSDFSSYIDLNKNKLNLFHLFQNSFSLRSPSNLTKQESSENVGIKQDHSHQSSSESHRHYKDVEDSKEKYVSENCETVLSDESSTEDDCSDSEKEDLYPMILYIQRYCELAVVLLLDQEVGCDEEVIHKLWQVGLNQLSNLESTIKQGKEQSSSMESYPFIHQVVFDVAKRQLSGGFLPFSSKQRVDFMFGRHIQQIRENFKKNPGLSEVRVVSLDGKSVLAHQSSGEQAFFQEIKPPSSLVQTTSRSGSSRSTGVVDRLRMEFASLVH
ncbi:uncharacterized protein LOC106467126 isoform X3 [Limulus polyphemus]|nr:uncharacterized protein LOC106467126 isoform X2 [Limulus polyphemus]XP_022250966.1 uncharacterized protein LOC106467126 isoform X3 [Limulus polyphemus]